MRMLFAACALLLFTGLSGCSTYSDSEKTDFDDKISNFIQKKGWKMEKLPSGLYLEVIQDGTGDEKAKFTSQVTLVYTGKLVSGKVFDQTDPRKPLISQLNKLIAGFQESLLDRTAGTHLRLVIPPHLGYGDEVLEKIPANSILVYDVELKEVH